MVGRTQSTAIILVALLVGFQAGFIITQQADAPENDFDDGAGGNQTILQRQVVDFNVTDSREQLYNAIFRNARGSVVSITPLQEGSSGTQQIAVGSGFVYDTDGRIVTNRHVVEEGDMFDVTFLDGGTYEAELVGTDPYTDLAVLDVDTTEQLDPLDLGSSANISVGQTVLAIGNPFGLSGSMTTGIVSQTGRLLPAANGFSIPNVIQTDAAINPGNSGGPLLNIEGDVIGINTAIDTRTRTFSGVGFAVPVDTVRRVVPTLIEEGGYSHPWIGVRGIDVSPPIAEEMDLEQARGFLVVEVSEDSPAESAGLEGGDREVNIRGNNVNAGGDVIVEIDGRPVRKLSDILNYLAKETEVGDTIELTVIRDGQRQTLDLTLEERPAVN